MPPTKHPIEIFNMPLEIRPETDQDYEAIRQINRLAFGRDVEAQLVDDLRAESFAKLSLVAVRQGQVVGHILFSDQPIVAESGTVSALLLAPLAVLPDFQRQGIGAALVREGLDQCRALGHQIVLLFGHPEYYPRFGFSAALARQITAPFAGDMFMAAELTDDAMDGLIGSITFTRPFQGIC
jgi:putative acetyltransferase